MGLFDAATGGATGGIGALFGGGTEQSRSGDISGAHTFTGGAFVFGGGDASASQSTGTASGASSTSTAAWITAAASLLGLGVTLYLAYRVKHK